MRQASAKISLGAKPILISPFSAIIADHLGNLEFILGWRGSSSKVADPQQGSVS